MQEVCRSNLVVGVILSGLALDLTSIIGWAHPSFGAAAMLILLAAVTLGTLFDLRVGAAAILLELLWGSHGYLLNLPLGGVSLSFRMGLFLIVTAVTFWRLRRADARAVLRRAIQRPISRPFWLLVIILILGIIIGSLRHPFHLVFFDANAWLFLLLSPTFFLALKDRDPASTPSSTWLFRIFLAGAGYLIIRTLALIFIFSHDLGGIWMAVYRWVRDTRLGEVTIFPGGFPRVFLPSMALLFPALFLAGERIIASAPFRRIVPPLLIFGGGTAVLIFSLSRSFWLAGIVMICLLIFWRAALFLTNPKKYYETKVSRQKILQLAVSALAGFAVVLVIIRIPYPKPLVSAVGQTMISRLFTVQETAISNRWQELGPLRAAIDHHPILGSGFGAAVTYETKDPRTLADHPDGLYTTTAFEWGYLDLVLKVGLIGLLAFLWLIGSILKLGMRNGGAIAALTLGFLAIAVTHITSPYLNHPIGLGILMWLLVLIAPNSQNRSARLEDLPAIAAEK